MIERIKQRVAELEAEIDRVAAEANEKLAINAIRIEELKLLILELA